ncbi:CRISPR-associated protein [Oscillatoriales cyanobacterium USR001]|nr:CRISPR-associated protein [Oscillatoriales cyanobacterium USR001]
MPRLVISTVGTSLLTNQINLRRDPKDWSSRLQEMANKTQDDIRKYHQDVDDIIQQLRERAEKTLSNGTILEIRDASAELNGIYGLYEEQLEQGKQDVHWLITTDTAQGQVAAEIVKDFLQTKNFTVDIYQPKDLSTTSTRQFTQGIDELLKWMDEIIPGYKDSGYIICFNLVGGFKALQGYVNTIGMFYQANEMIYIFEGSSEIIKIPRLPIQVDKSVIKPVQFALMAEGAWIKLSELIDVPKTLLFGDGDEATLSHWGRLIWNRSKLDFLSRELLEFPLLKYESSFIKDYESKKEPKDKLKLQEVLGKISHLLIKHKGDTAVLKGDGGVLYEVYTNKGGIAHFRVTQGIRVSCTSSGGVLHLRHYGKEPDVNKNP